MVSDLMKELLANQDKLYKILQKLRYIAKIIDNQELLRWITNELEGYKDKKDCPKYREYKSLRFYYSGINGNIQFSDTVLDLGYFGNEKNIKEVKELLNISVCFPISQIEGYIENKESSSVYLDFSFLCNLLYENSGIVASRIYLKISKIKLSEIHNIVFNMVQDIILELEKTVGVEKLNSLTIDLTKKEMNEINKKIEVIVKNEENPLAVEDRKMTKKSIIIGKTSVVVTIICALISIVCTIVPLIFI